MTPEKVQAIARLARLVVPEKDEAALADELTGILDHVDLLREVETEGVEPFTHAGGTPGILGPDDPAPPLDRDQVLGVAPEREGDHFRVPRVIEEA